MGEPFVVNNMMLHKVLRGCAFWLMDETLIKPLLWRPPCCQVLISAVGQMQGRQLNEQPLKASSNRCGQEFLIQSFHHRWWIMVAVLVSLSIFCCDKICSLIFIYRFIIILGLVHDLSVFLSSALNFHSYFFRVCFSLKKNLGSRFSWKSTEATGIEPRTSW